MQTLTAKDYKILSELDRNSRQSISSIARSVGLSKQAVAYRMKVLLDNKVVNHLLPVIDSQRLGFTFYNVFLNVREKDSKNIVEFLSSQPEVSWLVSCVGKWNVVAAVLAKDTTELQELLERVQEKFNESLEGKSFQIIIDAFPCDKKHLSGKKIEDVRRQYYGYRTPYELDVVDKRILRELNNNVRLSSLKMAEKLMLSPNTVKSRIKKMHSDGLIQRFSMKINPFKLGLEWYYTLFELETATKEQKGAIIETLYRHNNVVFVANAIGIQSLNVDFHVKNQLELKDIIHSLHDDFPFIKSHESLLVTEEHKCTFIPEKLVAV
ncbi:AsnC family transcriptional regulator [Candidatus Woesearchaeota archaeon]|nr:AsnC family transcriptional regulator [Candidatus Woesearchaeota archaeon]